MLKTEGSRKKKDGSLVINKGLKIVAFHWHADCFSLSVHSRLGVACGLSRKYVQLAGSAEEPSLAVHW